MCLVSGRQCEVILVEWQAAASPLRHLIGHKILHEDGVADEHVLITDINNPKKLRKFRVFNLLRVFCKHFLLRINESKISEASSYTDFTEWESFALCLDKCKVVQI